MLVGLVVSVACLAAVVWHVDWHAFMAELRGADPLLVAAAFAVTPLACAVRVVRWRIVFAFAQAARWTSLASVLMIGFLANNLLPARLGDLAMAVLFHRKEGLGRSRAMGAIILDRACDVAALVLLLAPFAFIYQFPVFVRAVLATGAAGALAGFALVLLCVRHPARSARIVALLAGWLPRRIAERIAHIFAMLLEGMSIVANPLRMAAALAVSLVIWGMLAVGVYALFAAYGFTLDFGAALVVVAIVNLGLVVPSSPGFVGTFQLFCVAALALYGIDRSSALGFSILYHLSQWLPTTLIGYYFLSRDGLSLGASTRWTAPGIGGQPQTP